MGQDKSLLVYHGKPQREHLTDLLRPYCAEVWWSVNPDQVATVTDPAQRYVVDAFAVNSPLNGILSAFRQNPSVAWLVVACDMPRLTSLTLDALVAGRNPAKVATTFYDSDGQAPEPLLAIYEPAIGPVLQQRLAEGVISPRKILMENDSQVLTAPDVRELLNVNDPDARARWQS
ncbi:Molybdenum cofactor biosynthesis bifunctional protein Includes: RecName: Full=Molybdenum cofactor biosynthesis protein C [Fibrisoma limi BUZ 3]|uniref:MoaC protein n=2 Tax=Fibrisoma limi TaxID=663275 RepID=I2GEI9_9BACT|nr:Molybdenum cofactor biosynthesis bifunctional protein Includes: RecName: Full=Molybdenum cofactor biosynthesis protein C [Fibrisoma limi BUZ 3]